MWIFNEMRWAKALSEIENSTSENEAFCKAVSAGFAVFTSESDLTAYQDRVIEEANAIKRSRRTPEQVQAQAERARAVGKEHGGRKKKNQTEVFGVD